MGDNYTKTQCKKGKSKGKKAPLHWQLRTAKKAAIREAAKRTKRLLSMDASHAAHQRSITSAKTIIDLIDKATAEDRIARADVDEERIKQRRNC